MISFLKFIVSLSNLFIAWFILILFFHYLKKRRLFYWGVLCGVLVFLMCSTNYIPKKLIHNYERQYKVLNITSLDTTKHYYIHILAAGYEIDQELPASAQLKPNSLARMIEGIRIYNNLSNKTIIASGGPPSGIESQASVTKKAMIEMRVASEDILLLNTPSTTHEEAMAFRDYIGKKENVIIVTDAQHMSRAIKVYQLLGFKPIAAPTNFMVKNGKNSYNGFSLPNFGSFQLMENWFREFLATIKFKYFH